MVYGGSGETALHDRACTLSNGPKDCQGQLLGGCGDPRLQGRASALSTGHTECQGHLLGGSGAEHHQARACTFGIDSHKECPGGDLHPRARALHGVGTELLDCGAGGFKDVPGHGLGGEESELGRTGHMAHGLREVLSPNWNFRIFQRHPVHCSLETGCTLALR